MIAIYFKDGSARIYKCEEYTEYKYDAKYFIIIKDWKWIGMYNLDCIKMIEVDR